MMSSSTLLSTVLVFLCVINSGLFKELPSYIHVCKRDPKTIDACVRQSITDMKPQLIAGIPELDVPSMDPFIIPEITSSSSFNIPTRASGKNVRVIGLSNFNIKKLSVDLNTFTIKTRVRFPKIHIEGQYKLDTQSLIKPLKGEGNIKADAVNADTDLVIQMQIALKDGVEYMKFKKIDTDVNVKDYRVEFDGLFNGDKSLNDAANAVINQNRAEFFKQIEAHLEKTISKILLGIANKIVDGLTVDQVLLKP